jgi:hypothetical protein
MRVKLCVRCPYTPQDLADHYDPEAALHVCARCDGEQRKPGKYYPREANRRGKCTIAPNALAVNRRGVPAPIGTLSY